MLSNDRYVVQQHCWHQVEGPTPRVSKPINLLAKGWPLSNHPRPCETPSASQQVEVWTKYGFPMADVIFADEIRPDHVRLTSCLDGMTKLLNISCIRQCSQRTHLIFVLGSLWIISQTTVCSIASLHVKDVTVVLERTFPQSFSPRQGFEKHSFEWDQSSHTTWPNPNISFVSAWPCLWSSFNTKDLPFVKTSAQKGKWSTWNRAWYTTVAILLLSVHLLKGTKAYTVPRFVFTQLHFIQNTSVLRGCVPWNQYWIFSVSHLATKATEDWDDKLSQLIRLIRTSSWERNLHRNHWKTNMKKYVQRIPQSTCFYFAASSCIFGKFNRVVFTSSKHFLL